MVHDSEDGIVPALRWQSHNQVHCNLSKWESVFGRCDLVEGCFLSVGDNFVLLAVATAFYVIGYPFTHSCPIMRLACFSDRFISPGVSSHGVIVYKSH